MRLYDYLLSQNLTLIPATDIIVTETDQTYGYDFTVEDNFTFCTYDGVFVQDTMAVVMPQTEQAQKELKEGVEKFGIQASTGRFKFRPSWDFVYGVYLITKEEKTNTSTRKINFSDAEELLDQILKKPKIASYRINKVIKGKRVTTTYGRLLINLLTPDFFKDIINEPLTAKKISSILTKMAQEEMKRYSSTLKTQRFYKYLLDIGRKVSTVLPLRIELSSAKAIQTTFKKILDKLDKQNIFEGLKTIDEIMEKVKKVVKKYDPELYDAIESGARGSWTDIQQMLVAKGYVTDPVGRVIPEPVKSNLSQGLTPDEFFTTGYSARKGIVDRAINTSIPGYLLRRLVIVCSSVYLDTVMDCGTDNYLEITVNDEKEAAMFLYRNVNGKVISDEEETKKLIGKKIKVRTPIFCKARGICKTCYGDLYKYHKSKQIGIIAAQAIGERTQQILMRTFHTGGLAKLKTFPEIFKDTKLTEIFKQDGDKIFMTNIATIRIPLTNDFQYILGQTLILKEGLVTFIAVKNDKLIDYNYELPEKEEIEIFYDDIIEIEGQQYAIINKKADPVARIWLSVSDISTQLKHIENLFNGSYKGKDYLFYYRHMQEILKEYGVHSVHIELVISQMMRNEIDPSKLFRHNQKKPYIILGSKQIPFYESPLLALTFEDVNKALNTALITDTKDKKSPLEAIIDGDVNELKKQTQEPK